MRKKKYKKKITVGGKFNVLGKWDLKRVMNHFGGQCT